MHYKLIDMDTGETIAKGSQERMMAEAQPGELVLRVLDDETVEVVYKREPEPVWSGHCQHTASDIEQVGRFAPRWC